MSAGIGSGWPRRAPSRGGRQDSAAGYRVDGAVPVAAVEVQHPGRVWFAKALSPEQHAELGCLLAGLLLYQPPELR